MGAYRGEEDEYDSKDYCNWSRKRMNQHQHGECTYTLRREQTAYNPTNAARSDYIR